MSIILWNVAPVRSFILKSGTADNLGALSPRLTQTTLRSYGPRAASVRMDLT